MMTIEELRTLRGEYARLRDDLLNLSVRLDEIEAATDAALRDFQHPEKGGGT